jgi:DnaK suppressor protein
MDAAKIKEVRKRLASEYENLVKSLKRSQIASEEIKLEKTEDEGDLASISHDRDVLINLHEGGFARLRLIQKAIEAVDSGQYGICVRCEAEINEKRLDAVPWTDKCIRCQEEIEAVKSSSIPSLAGFDLEAEP